MRILVLSKRFYTGKDLIGDRFGRVFELPAWLARSGHEVTGLALSYRPAAGGEHRWDDLPDLVWHSANIGRVPFRSYFRTLHRLIRETQPELIWVCSDAFHAILGEWLQRHFRIPTVVDLYDNFEGFPATRLPGVLSLFRRACRNASGLTLVGTALRDYVQREYDAGSPMLVLQNGTNPILFQPHDRAASRRTLGLPEHGRFIGTAGSISAGRGIVAMFEAFLELAKEMPDLHLVFAGPRDGTALRYRHPRIIDLGILPQERVPLLLSALDLGVISNLDSPFGRYCFPQKLYEFAACGIPFVAADVGETAAMLRQQPHLLFSPNNAGELAGRVRGLLEGQCPPQLTIPVRTWEELGGELEAFFRDRILSH
jgi:glycosyltransferase involved in cell wall biosynthesis